MCIGITPSRVSILARLRVHRPFIFSLDGTNFKVKLTFARPTGRTSIYPLSKILNVKLMTMSPSLLQHNIIFSQ